MSKITKLTLMAVFFACGTALAQIQTPQPSSAGSVSSIVGLTEVTIDYFRPKMKGRMIFGEGKDYLQPYGQLWRTGANSGSTLTLSTDAKIAGNDVEAGKYLILTIPGKDEWTFILYSDPTIGGNMSKYKEENAVVKAMINPMKLATPVEILSFQITDISADNTKASIQLSWSDVALSVPMEVSYEDEVLASIAANTKVNPSNYTAAANFYLSINKDLGQALKWMDLYLAEGNNAKQFWHVHTKARIQAAMGDKKGAKATAKSSMEMAKANEGGDFGYIKRNEDLIASLK